MGLFSAILEKLGVSHATALGAPGPQPTATPKAAPTPMAPPPPASMKVVDVVGKLEALGLG